MGQDFVILGSDSQRNPDTSAEQEDERLVAAGWVRRHSVDVDRVEEFVELYRSLGFEVQTRALTPADYDPSCRDCAASACPMHVLIYTRKVGDCPKQ